MSPQFSSCTLATRKKIAYALFLLVTGLPLPLLASEPVTKTACPEWVTKDQSLPPCPAGSSQILPDNYPASVVMISGWAPFTGYDPEIAAAFIEKVFKYSGPRKPLVSLPMSDEMYRSVMNMSTMWSKTEQEADELRRHFVQTTASTFAWLQDGFQAFTNAKGETEVRGAAGYEIRMNNAALVKSMEACRASEGKPLPQLSNSKRRGNDQEVLRNSFEGGNLEALPGGACLIGDANGDEKRIRSESKSFCPKSVIVPTRWLTVAHVDELVKVVRNPGKSAPCDFAIATASPRSAMKVLRSASEKDPSSKFFEVKIPEIKSSMRPDFYKPLKNICMTAVNSRRLKTPPSESPPSEGVEENANHKGPEFRIKVSTAQAEIQRISNRPSVYDLCKDVTNLEALKALEKNRMFMLQQDSLEEEMQKIRKLIQAQILKDLPSCSVDFIDVPVLFGASSEGPVKGSRAIPRSHLESILPNPINGVSIESAFITSDPMNSSFRAEMVDSFKRFGVTADFINTFFYSAHANGGGLHCITNAIRACRPNP